MIRSYWFVLFATLSLGASLACSSESNSGSPSSSNATATGATGATTSAAHQACQRYCMAEIDCDASTTLEDCYGYTCDDLLDETLTPGCDTTLKEYYDCLAAASDVCDPIPFCETAGEMAGTACE